MLIEKIAEDKLVARKTGDRETLMILTVLHAEASRPGKDNGNRNSTDSEVIQVIKKMIKSNDETIGKLFERSNGELWGKDINSEAALRKENSILKSYLPSQLTEDELVPIIEKFITDQDELPKVGDVMKFLKDNYDGRYDGKSTSALIKTLL